MASRLETVPQFDAGNVAQVDVEKDTDHLVEVTVICEGFSGAKRQTGVAELPQQSRHALQHRNVVIDDELAG